RRTVATSDPAAERARGASTLEGMSRTLSLAVIPGDGIGPEVTAEALRILEAVAGDAGLVIEPTTYRLGAERYLEDGEVLPEDEFAAIKRADAILFGAVGGVPGDPRLKN